MRAGILSAALPPGGKPVKRNAHSKLWDKQEDEPCAACGGPRALKGAARMRLEGMPCCRFPSFGKKYLQCPAQSAIP